MTTILLLTVSNIFMTFAWYGHLKFKSADLWKVVLVFCVFSILYLHEGIKWNYVVGFVLIVGAAFFIFHKW